MTTEVVLENEHACVRVLPTWGAGLAGFDLRSRGQRIPAFRPLSHEPRDEGDLALYLLAPFSNRIGGGGFSWRAQRYALAPNIEGEACPLHGDAWRKPWEVVARHPQQVVLRLSSRDAGSPFHYDAQITWTLQAAALSGELMLTHRGEQAMLYGGGFHPWFLRDADTTLQASASGWWAQDAHYLPTTWQAFNEKDALSFHTPRRLPAHFLNAGYTDWDGRARIVWPTRGVGLTVQAQAPLNRYMFYSPGAQAAFFCFEPVSHDVNAHNALLPIDSGLTELKPGHSLRLLSVFSAFSY